MFCVTHVRMLSWVYEGFEVGGRAEFAPTNRLFSGFLTAIQMMTLVGRLLLLF
jgi:hypothetical protein